MLLTDVGDAQVADAVASLDGWRLLRRADRDLPGAVSGEPDARAVLVAAENPTTLRLASEAARRRGLPVIALCRDDAERRRAVELRVDEWYLPSASAEEIALRLRSAVARATPTSREIAERALRVEREEMLHDFLTGLPTLPVVIERSRAMIKERGELIVLYLNFVRYSKIEEIYGWERLDAVLETTAAAVRDFMRESALSTSRAMVSFANDDDFVLIHVPAPGVPVATDAEVTEIAGALERSVAQRIEAAHGEEVSALFDIYVGRAHVYYNPKVRLERLLYRGIREAADAAKGIEQRERARKVDDLRASLRDRLVYIDYPPIVVAESRPVFGAPGAARSRPLAQGRPASRRSGRCR